MGPRQDSLYWAGVTKVLEQLCYLSQSISSVAVVGSLIYLGLQVRAAD